MKVSINWLKQLVDLKVPIDELIKLLNLKTIGTKEVTSDFIELDMKGYNRADLLSLRGVAYEVAAITDSEIHFKDLSDSEYLWVEQSLPKVTVEVQDENLSPIYCIAKIENLKVAPSEKDWQDKLKASGIRAINNVADVTNLVMVEYGQPLHSFDASVVKDEKIVVRTAKKGEKITSLDDKVRELEPSDLLITDPEKALGIAGVMGGENSEITDSTHTILLEAAIFDPINIRKTATRLGLHSEASKRFQHGITAKRLFQALDAAIKMYQGLGGKLTALTIVGENEKHLNKIPLSLRKVNDLIGTKITKDQVEEYLKKLNFELKDEKNAGGEPAWVVTPPYYRLDIEIEEDLVEEVARMYGYERIPAKELEGEIPEKDVQPIFELMSKLKTTLVDLGLTEVQTYSYYTNNVLNALGFNDENKKILLKIANPISSETEYLRMNLWPNLLEVIDKNLRQSLKDIAIFEIGKIFYINEKGKQDEKYVLVIAVTNNTDNPSAELFSIYEKLNNQLSLGMENTNIGEGAAKKLGLFHPNRLIQLKKGDKMIGGLGEVHKRVTDKMSVNKRVAILEIGIPKLL